MKMHFKSADNKEYECGIPVEQKLFDSNGNARGWVVTFSIHADFTSADVDTKLTENAISEMTFTTDENKTIEITGYNKIHACAIRHVGVPNSIEIQLKKEA